MNQSLDAHQPADNMRENSPFSKKPSIKRSRCYDLQKKLIQQNVDRREAIR